MARTPNYSFERRERERQKAEKAAAKAEAKAAAKAAAKAERDKEEQRRGREPVQRLDEERGNHGNPAVVR